MEANSFNRGSFNRFIRIRAGSLFCYIKGTKLLFKVICEIMKLQGVCNRSELNLRIRYSRRLSHGALVS